MRRPTRPGHAISNAPGPPGPARAARGVRAGRIGKGSRQARRRSSSRPPPGGRREDAGAGRGQEGGCPLRPLGCGDGRIVVTAVQKYGIRAVGIDIDGDPIATEKNDDLPRTTDSRKRW